MGKCTLFWTCENEEPGESLEKVDLGNGMDASIFLHGVCGIFALALHEIFGYELFVVAEEPEDWEDANSSWMDRLVHIYCQKGEKYIDVRGVTDDKEAFFGEFSDFLYGDDEFIKLTAHSLRDFIIKAMSLEEFEDFYSDARSMIQQNFSGYLV